MALVQPSFFESFSMVLTEAWAAGVPALVQGRCAVLVGQALRSGGGLPYIGYAQFEAMLDRLLGEQSLRSAIGDRGRQYVHERYSWDRVLTRYELFLRVVRTRKGRLRTLAAEEIPDRLRASVATAATRRTRLASPDRS